MRIFFVRHGQTPYNVMDLCSDDPNNPDVNLTELGREQARKAGKFLLDAPFEKIIISEFPRTRETAELIRGERNIPIVVDNRMNERLCGFEGKPLDEFRDALDEAENKLTVRLNYGESYMDEKDRILSFLKDIKLLGDDCLLVVTHGQPFQIILGHFKGMGDLECLDVPVANCEIYSIDI
jgi:broad specificity phosphatase PhoE